MTTIALWPYDPVIPPSPLKGVNIPLVDIVVFFTPFKGLGGKKRLGGKGI